jgi:ABC-2 type transport system ATP-binding protein
MTASFGAAPVIRVRGLTKRYGDVKAVDGIDFDVAKGQIFGLLGPNGAGKTTTVEILEGLREADGGEVSVLGVDVMRDADAIKPRIGVSLQTAALYPKLTVTELVNLFRSFYPRPARRKSHGRASSSANGTTPEPGLSGGQRQAPRGRAVAGERPGARVPRRAHDRSRSCRARSLWTSSRG